MHSKNAFNRTAKGLYQSHMMALRSHEVLAYKRCMI